MQGTKTRHGYSRSVLCNIRKITKPGYTSKICDRALTEVEYWHNLPFSSLPVFLTVPFCEASQTGPRRRLCMAQSRGASKSLPLLAFVFLSPKYIKDTILSICGQPGRQKWGKGLGVERREPEERGDQRGTAAKHCGSQLGYSSCFSLGGWGQRAPGSAWPAKTVRTPTTTRTDFGLETPPVT